MRVDEETVSQVQLWNKVGVTWVPGVRAVKIRAGRHWLKILAGHQNIKFYWGASPRKTLTR